MQHFVSSFFQFEMLQLSPNLNQFFINDPTLLKAISFWYSLKMMK